MSDKFKGHARGTIVKQIRNDSSGYFLQWHGMVVAQCMTKPNAELFAAAPDLLTENERLKAENERLRDQVADLVGAITSLNHAKHHEVIIGDDVGYYQRKEWVEWILDLAAQQ